MTRDFLEVREHALHLHLKVVPGGAKSHVVGPYGDRLRVKVSAPPEGGKANRAVLALLAERLGLPAKQLAVVRGHGSPQKTVALPRMDADRVRRALAAD